jgi:pyridoxamine 5'-phosphate oxidase
MIERLLEGVGLPEPLPSDPMPTLMRWFDEAMAAQATPSPEAFALATADGSGRPSVRVVLCKGLRAEGAVVFFSNYMSRKGEELAANPRASGVFHWDAAGRQARFEGAVSRLGAKESDAYFRTRPVLSKLGAWASEQSRGLSSRAELARRVLEAAERFNLSIGQVLSPSSEAEIPRPGFWGGYCVTLDRVELWQGGRGRLHDRAAWVREGGAGMWRAGRLFP